MTLYALQIFSYCAYHFSYAVAAYGIKLNTKSAEANEQWHIYFARRHQTGKT